MQIYDNRERSSVVFMVIKRSCFTCDLCIIQCLFGVFFKTVGKFSGPFKVFPENVSVRSSIALISRSVAHNEKAGQVFSISSKPKV